VTAIADHVATEIRAAGLGSGDAVAVLGARDGRLPAVLLGVLASGARWVILDQALPPRVLARQLRAADARALIRCQPEDARQPTPGQLPLIDAGSSSLLTWPAGRSPVCQPRSARGYLGLSSGTTGEPKVIVTGERPLAHFLGWYPATFGLDAGDRFAMLAGLAHDPLLRDIFTPLVLGAVLCVPEQAWLRDPGRLTAWLRAERVTVAHLTPQLARLLATGGRDGQLLPALRLIALAGDQATSSDVSELRGLAPGARVVNFYGTTETPQAQAWHDVTDLGTTGHQTGHQNSHKNSHQNNHQAARAQLLPVGQGIDGAQLLVLGPHGQPAGVGELGEIAIRSRYLADGYADPALTADRFTVIPGGDADDRMFLTGDRGRYRVDGAVVLTGRADDQVKIRGFRVELGEVEAVLTAHPDVRQAFVIAEGSGERTLSAYVVPARAGVREQQLPEYAVPASVILVPALPLTPNGKVDAAALPRGPLRVNGGSPGELSSGTERVIAGVWREVLGLVRIGPHDNFFDVGGHSLTLVAVHAKLTRVLSRPVSVVDLFQYPSIRALAGHLDGAGRGGDLDRGLRRAAQRRERVRLRTPRRSQEQESVNDEH
jgi:amino acid adenylation domain-containing protein